MRSLAWSSTRSATGGATAAGRANVRDGVRKVGDGAMRPTRWQGGARGRSGRRRGQGGNQKRSGGLAPKKRSAAAVPSVSLDEVVLEDGGGPELAVGERVQALIVERELAVAFLGAGLKMAARSR